MFKDKKKAEQKAMAMNNKLPAFNDFTSKHSKLAILFNIQGAATSALCIDGLQIRNLLEQLIQ